MAPFGKAGAIGLASGADSKLLGVENARADGLARRDSAFCVTVVLLEVTRVTCAAAGLAGARWAEAKAI
jgi:hypothetical protein